MTADYVFVWGGVSGSEAVREIEAQRVLGREVGKGLRTWAAIFEEWGYIPTGINCRPQCRRTIRPLLRHGRLCASHARCDAVIAGMAGQPKTSLAVSRELGLKFLFRRLVMLMSNDERGADYLHGLANRRIRCLHLILKLPARKSSHVTSGRRSPWPRVT